MQIETEHLSTDMKVLFCEHPNKPLRNGYCSYYSEIFYALKEFFDIEFKILFLQKPVTLKDMMRFLWDSDTLIVEMVNQYH